jgi:hypothetical protein
MSKRTIKYYKNRTQLPKNPVVITARVVFEDWEKASKGSVFFNVDVGRSRYGEGGVVALTVDEMRALRDEIDVALADADRVLAVEIKEQEKFLAELEAEEN